MTAGYYRVKSTPGTARDTSSNRGARHAQRNDERSRCRHCARIRGVVPLTAGFRSRFLMGDELRTTAFVLSQCRALLRVTKTDLLLGSETSVLGELGSISGCRTYTWFSAVSRCYAPLCGGDDQKNRGGYYEDLEDSERVLPLAAGPDSQDIRGRFTRAFTILVCRDMSFVAVLRTAPQRIRPGNGHGECYKGLRGTEEAFAARRGGQDLVSNYE
ncbi:hypothetical protein Hypma_000406 [Hypsizygus marmoreus]|uniref:Uncharacterized protein n=1 Tax=Hypsizygus marmoreus TaxID=39966 RepID=A0A369JFD9_HYPMA|nr:hypothetical protein Hypma_000406 [Hypsizygus marmoreus]